MTYPAAAGPVADGARRVPTRSARRYTVARLVTVAGALAGYVLAVLQPSLAGEDPVADRPGVLVITGLVLVFCLPLVAYLAAVGSVRALAGLTGRGRPVLDGLVVVVALVCVALYVSPWGIAATRGFLLD